MAQYLLISDPVGSLLLANIGIRLGFPQTFSSVPNVNEGKRRISRSGFHPGLINSWPLSRPITDADNLHTRLPLINITTGSCISGCKFWHRESGLKQLLYFRVASKHKSLQRSSFLRCVVSFKLISWSYFLNLYRLRAWTCRLNIKSGLKFGICLKSYLLSPL